MLKKLFHSRSGFLIYFIFWYAGWKEGQGWNKRCKTNSWGKCSYAEVLPEHVVNRLRNLPRRGSLAFDPLWNHSCLHHLYLCYPLRSKSIHENDESPPTCGKRSYSRLRNRPESGRRCRRVSFNYRRSHDWDKIMLFLSTDM